MLFYFLNGLVFFSKIEFSQESFLQAKKIVQVFMCGNLERKKSFSKINFEKEEEN